MFCFVGNPKDAPRPGILDTALFFFALEACQSAVIPFVVYFFVTKSYQFTLPSPHCPEEKGLLSF